VSDFMMDFVDEMQAAHADVTAEIQSTGAISDASADTIRGALEAFKLRVCAPKTPAEEER